jgi:predicted RNA binding protein YcfA (HicA-like mRNA interferase family)
MPPLPIISGKDLIEALAKCFGYAVARQRGSHVMVQKQAAPSSTVPLHSELDRGTLRAILRQLGITVDQLVDCLR